jgi:hypothetical protein
MSKEEEEEEKVPNDDHEHENELRIQELERQVAKLRAQNAQTTQRWQEERLQWESRHVDQERVESDLRTQLEGYQFDRTAFSKTREELEAAHDELNHLSQLYSDFMAWKHDKLTLEGERDKLLFQNRRQQQTIACLEQHYNNNSSDQAKADVEDQLRKYDETHRHNSSQRGGGGVIGGRDGTSTSSAMEQASFVKGVVAEKKQSSKNGFWSNWSFLIPQDEDYPDEDETTNLNALKRLDDRMARAEQLSKSSSNLPPVDEQLVQDDDDDHYYHVNSNGSSGFGFFQRGLLEQQRNERFDYSKRDLDSHPRVSEGPQNLQNILNLM